MRGIEQVPAHLQYINEIRLVPIPKSIWIIINGTCLLLLVESYRLFYSASHSLGVDLEMARISQSVIVVSFFCCANVWWLAGRLSRDVLNVRTHYQDYEHARLSHWMPKNWRE